MSFRCLPPLGSPSALTGGSRSRSSPAGGRGCSSVTTAPWCAPAVATTSPRLSPPSWPSTLPVCELCSTASLSPAPGPSPASTGSARRRPQRLLRAGHVRRLRPAVGGRQLLNGQPHDGRRRMLEQLDLPRASTAVWAPTRSTPCGASSARVARLRGERPATGRLEPAGPLHEQLGGADRLHGAPDAGAVRAAKSRCWWHRNLASSKSRRRRASLSRPAQLRGVSVISHHSEAMYCNNICPGIR
jgi:hypothetical protein